MNPNKLAEIISCVQAAHEAQAVLGLAAHAPVVAELIQDLQSCCGHGCPGTPRAVIIAATGAAMEEDRILALHN